MTGAVLMSLSMLLIFCHLSSQISMYGHFIMLFLCENFLSLFSLWFHLAACFLSLKAMCNESYLWGWLCFSLSVFEWLRQFLKNQEHSSINWSSTIVSSANLMLHYSVMWCYMSFLIFKLWIIVLVVILLACGCPAL